MSTILKPAADLIATMLLVATVIAGLAIPSRAKAAEPVAFAVPAEDGYGIADCMQSGNACGAAIADSFCQAHGHHKSIAFGLGTDVTGTMGPPDPAAVHDDVLIRCAD